MIKYIIVLSAIIWYSITIRNEDKTSEKGNVKDMRTRTFLIKDIDCEMIIEETTRKEVLDWMNEYIENSVYDWFDGSDEAFSILYKDGTTDFINEEYDGHKVRKTNIESIVYDNPCTSIVFGNYEINEYGVVTPSFEMAIATDNIIEK